MKILVIGLGSMGQRRIRLLKQIQPDSEIHGIELNLARRKMIANKLNIQVYGNLVETDIRLYDCVIICTSPLTHSKIIKQLIPYELPIFTELNLVTDGYSEFKNEEKRLFLSSTLLYRKDIQYIKERVKGRKVDYNYHVGQYLPDWHPWECYKDYFVVDKRTNGCREIMAIDFPWIISCFGNVTKMHVLKDKITKLDIDYYDNYLIMFEHETGAKGVVTVDVVSRKAMRKLEVFSEDFHLFWDGTPQSLSEFNLDMKNTETISVYDTTEQNSKYSENIIEDAYRDELTAFMAMVQNADRGLVRYSFSEDEEILQLIDKIES